MDIENNNKLVWYKTSEVEPPAKTQVWVCESRCGKLRKPVRLDSWDPITKTWNNHGYRDLDKIYWTYPIYPEVK